MRCTCGKCDISFASISDYQKHICGMENKMTREEALTRLRGTTNKDYAPKDFINMLEALGLLKFDEQKEIVKVFEINKETGDVTDNAYTFGPQLVNKYGTIRLEEWPEGLVLWVGGEIVWKSWVNSVPDLIIIEARKYVDDCRTKPYESSQAFKIISDHFKMLEKLLEYVEKKKGA